MSLPEISVSKSRLIFNDPVSCYQQLPGFNFCDLFTRYHLRWVVLP
jgi:hypothetical protein